MTWTRFYDMCSGGREKEEWENIYIEAPKEEARVIFYNRFGHNPDRVSCTCCGEDYSISESPTLLEITEYERRDRTLEDYMANGCALFIHAEEIMPEERHGEVPEQGYVWQ